MGHERRLGASRGGQTLSRVVSPLKSVSEGRQCLQAIRAVIVCGDTENGLLDGMAVLM